MASDLFWPSDGEAIRFEQPINFDLVCVFDFLAMNARDEKAQDFLFLLAKEGPVNSASP